MGHLRKGKHVRIYRLSTQFIISMWSQDNLIRRTQVTQGWPEDAEITDVTFAWANGVITLYVEHPSFDFVVEGEIIPQFNTILRDIEPADGQL